MLCSICLDTMNDEDCITISCFHAFHKACIKEWYITCHQNRTDEEIKEDPSAINLRNPCPNCKNMCEDSDWDAVFNNK